jgi:hypothetical protein
MELLKVYCDTCIVSGLAKGDLTQPDVEALLKVLEKNNKTLSFVTSQITKEEIDRVPQKYRVQH